MSCRRASMACVALFVMSVSILHAEVKKQERTKIEFAGPIGGVMKIFGGKSYRQGVVTSVALKGDRKMSITDNTAELVDLAAEKVYQIDMKDKSYSVMTFEQLRRQMQQDLEKARASSPEAKAQVDAKSGEQPQFEMDFKISETGQKKTIGGYDTREVLATITMHEKGKKAEDGSFVLTASMWLAPRIAALKEIEDFDRKFAEKLLLPIAREMAQEMAPALGAYPQLMPALQRLDQEKVNMDGTTVSTVIRAGVLAPPDQNGQAAAKESRQSEPPPTSIGGLLGGLGRKAVTRNKEKQENKQANPPGTIMTSTNEMVSISTSVSDADVSIPAGFKEKK